MSSVSPISPPPRKARSGIELVAYDRYIEGQLRKTRSHVRSVDFASALMLFVAAALAYLLVVALVDHWVVAGGLGRASRLALFAIFFLCSFYYLAGRVLPLVLKRINPIYAADAIERSQPSLKNSLINFLLLRSNHVGVSDAVLHAVEEQAATGLATVSVDAAVDRSRLIKIGYVLLAVLFCCALYKVISPKDPLRTVGRVLMPWADIQPPTRVLVSKVEPGSIVALRGQQLKISADVQGLAPDEEVTLLCTTADGQLIEQPIKMTVPEASYRYVCVIPQSGSGMQQDLEYRIVAGDATTERYRIHVVAAPTIVVEKVRYDYPAYTGLLPNEVDHQGDVKAIEGTRVTVRALANQDIAQASVDFDCDNTHDQRMRALGTRAWTTFPLALADDRATPEHSSYQLMFLNARRQENVQPIRHQIRVTADLSPEIKFRVPERDEIEVPLGRSVDMELWASDPDFGLGKVIVRASSAGRAPRDRTLLDTGWRGKYAKKFRLETAKMGLKPGDVVEYWAVAEDNKEPMANRVETPRRRLLIVAEDKQPPQASRDGGRNDQGDQSGDRAAGGRNGDAEGKTGDGGEQDNAAQHPQAKSQRTGDEPNPAGQTATKGEQPKQQEPRDASKNDGSAKDQAKQHEQNRDAGQAQHDEPVPSDGSDDGSAIERILDHKQKSEPKGIQAGEKPSGNQPGDQNQPGQQNGDTSASQTPEDKAGNKDKQDKQDGPKDKQQPQPQNKNGAQQPKQKGSPEDKGNEKGENQSGDDSGQADNAGGQTGSQPSDKQQGGQPGNQNKPDGPRGNQNSGQQPSASGSPSSGQPEKGGSPQGPRQVSDRRGREGEPSEHPNKDGKEPALDQEGSHVGKPDRASNEKSEADRASNPEDGGGEAQPNEGKGAQSKGQTRRRERPPDGTQRPNAHGGEKNKDLGDSGAGKSGNDDHGSPDAQKENAPRRKEKPGSKGEDKLPEDSPQVQSQSKRQSDSEGGPDGDKSGGGAKGGGQKADKAGTGGAGRNTAADEGSGASNQPGKGETGKGPGGTTPSGTPTGSAGAQRGQGSQTDSQSAGGNRPGAGGSASQAGGGGGTEQGANGVGKPATKAATPPQQAEKKRPDHADEANLEYAKKATDLALEHLKDQMKKGKPDKDLLNKLGWNEQELRAFLDRWRKMEAGAKRPGAQGDQARRELDDTLKSLGLRPRNTTVRANTGADDQVRGYRESRRSSPPPEYAEQYKAYTQGTARGMR